MLNFNYTSYPIALKFFGFWLVFLWGRGVVCWFFSIFEVPKIISVGCYVNDWGAFSASEFKNWGSGEDILIHLNFKLIFLFCFCSLNTNQIKLLFMLNETFHFQELVRKGNGAKCTKLEEDKIIVKVHFTF